VSPTGEPPFFIVGSARSGTTLLRLMLNAHPKVAIPPESRFITELWTGHDEVEVDPLLSELEANNRFQTWELPIAAVKRELDGRSSARYAEVMEAAYTAYARAQGKRRWGDKTPRYVRDIPLLAGLWPDARFIHLIRDGRNVALSYADVPFGPKNVATAAQLWSGRVRAGLRDGRPLGGKRYLEINYEDLVEDPKGEIGDLCEFLDLDFDDAMLNYTEGLGGVVLSRATVYNPNVRQPPNPSLRSWEQSMPNDHVEIFEAVAGDVLSELGYGRRFPAPSPTARAKAFLGSRGLPVGRLKRSGDRPRTETSGMDS
jgi:Sulfotransferase family